MKLNAQHVVIVKIISFLIAVILLLLGCGAGQNKSEIPKEMNYQDAKDYVAAYAEYQKISFKEVFDINTKTLFRGNVFNIEFEYDSTERVLIARGYIFHSTTGTLREDIWQKYLQIQNNPNTDEIRQLLPGAKLNFSNKKFELDRTIKEVKPDYFYRLNLRMDFVQISLTKSEFVKVIKALADEAFVWEKSYDSKIVSACNKEFFPLRAELYIKSYAESVKLPDVLIEKKEGGFISIINGVLFKFNSSGSLYISQEIPVVKNIAKDSSFYSNKIKNDSLWYWRASVSSNDDNLMLIIKIGDYSKSEKEVIEIIDHCINSISTWRQEL